MYFESASGFQDSNFADSPRLSSPLASDHPGMLVPNISMKALHVLMQGLLLT